MDNRSSGQTRHADLALARDVMTAKVIAVSPDEPVRNIAKVLLQNRISAVPVINPDGVPIGVVSEGDLVGRNDSDRLARSDWWLALIAGEQALDDKYQARLQAVDRTARDVMSAPIVTVTEDTDVEQIARLLGIFQIKRVPVLRDGRLIGIVSRADLLPVVAAGHAQPASEGKPGHRGFLAGLFGDYHLPAREAVSAGSPATPGHQQDDTPVAAEDFRRLAQDFHSSEAQHRSDARRAAAQQRKQRVRELIDRHVFGDEWRQLLQGARTAAEAGEATYMLLRFPCQLCIDGGRAIDVAESHWASTLRGEPAEVYLRWERELKRQGFRLFASILDFPDGKPGDVGLSLTW